MPCGTTCSVQKKWNIKKEFGYQLFFLALFTHSCVYKMQNMFNGQQTGFICTVYCIVSLMIDNVLTYFATGYTIQLY